MTPSLGSTLPHFPKALAVFQQTSSRLALRKTLTGLAAIAAVNATAQPTPGTGGSPAQPQAVVISGEIAYRDRTPDIAPTLTYGQDYFQRFEPSTAGDMVKRVPSATFVSDVLEFDAVQLRGLAPAYTQVLVNGKNVPGGAEDLSLIHISAMSARPSGRRARCACPGSAASCSRTACRACGHRVP